MTKQLDQKACSICGLVKPLADYYPHKGGRGSLSTFCKVCARAKALSHYHANGCTRNPLAAWRGSQATKIRNKRFADKIRAEAFTVYGGAECVCCQETEHWFLTLDHINGTGEGKKLRGCSFYSWLRRNGWPMQGDLRVMCLNCNSGRHWNGGQCPHKGLREIVTVNARWVRKLKEQGVVQYGDGTCACCGENNLGFLTLDHIDNFGYESGGEGRGVNRLGGNRLLTRLRQQGWPDKDKLQILCINCNAGRQMNGGVCPHRKAVLV